MPAEAVSGWDRLANPISQTGIQFFDDSFFHDPERSALDGNALYVIGDTSSKDDRALSESISSRTRRQMQLFPADVRHPLLA
jgi:hypothetical protein